MWLLFVVLLAVASEAAGGPTMDGYHPLTSPTSCHAFGPQAVLEVFRVKIGDINAELNAKYRSILKYLAEAPKLLDDYHGREELAVEHGDALTRLDNSLHQRLDVLRLDVLLPWARLMYIQQLGDVSGAQQAATRRALYTNLQLTLNSTETTEQIMLDNVSGLVEQFRQLFLSYKKIMSSWVKTAWEADSAEQKHETLQNIFRHDFPPMLGKPLQYLIEDTNLEFYHPYPCGYEEIFDMFQKIRSVMSKIESTSDEDAKWKLLLAQLPKEERDLEEPKPRTQAQIEMEEDVLSTHIIDMLTGYPKQKGKQY